MIYHVLPGDAQVNEFRETGIEGELLVCREALVEGETGGDTLDEFFNNRAAFANQADDEDPTAYNANVASQFRRLLDVGPTDEVNLWFEYELFCAVNMWFCLSLLQNSRADIYRVSPAHLTFEDRWDGFAKADSEILERCYGSRVRLTDPEVKLGVDLWEAFRRRDRNTLVRLTSESPAAFPYLDEVGRAAAEIDTAPALVVAQLMKEGKTDFNEIFEEFRSRAGVYGFGDLQVKRLTNEAV